MAQDGTSILGSFEAVPDPDPVYLKLRGQILAMPSGEAGIFSSDEFPHVWGILVESGYAEGVATLVCLADGTASLYFGTGGGMLGGVLIPEVASAAITLVKEAEWYYKAMVRMSKNPEAYPLPGIGRVRFYVLTFKETYTVEAGQEELEGEHLLAPLFTGGRRVIEQFRTHPKRPVNKG
jgi:hypothetical protein